MLDLPRTPKLAYHCDTPCLPSQKDAELFFLCGVCEEIFPVDVTDPDADIEGVELRAQASMEAAAGAIRRAAAAYNARKQAEAQ